MSQNFSFCSNVHSCWKSSGISRILRHPSPWFRDGSENNLGWRRWLEHFIKMTISQKIKFCLSAILAFCGLWYNRTLWKWFLYKNMILWYRIPLALTFQPFWGLRSPENNGFHSSLVKRSVQGWLENRWNLLVRITLFLFRQINNVFAVILFFSNGARTRTTSLEYLL